MDGPVLLDSAAFDAVKTWRYKPYLQDGEPVAVRTKVIVVFTLDDDPHGASVSSTTHTSSKGSSDSSSASALRAGTAKIIHAAALVRHTLPDDPSVPQEIIDGFKDPWFTLQSHPDLNGDGNPETMTWNLETGGHIVDGKTKRQLLLFDSIGGEEFHILPNMTNGYHDLLDDSCRSTFIFKFDGKTYQPSTTYFWGAAEGSDFDSAGCWAQRRRIVNVERQNVATIVKEPDPQKQDALDRALAARKDIGVEIHSRANDWFGADVGTTHDLPPGTLDSLSQMVGWRSFSSRMFINRTTGVLTIVLYCKLYGTVGQYKVSRDDPNYSTFYLPLLVRLFDSNGNYLTHFETSEVYGKSAMNRNSDHNLGGRHTKELQNRIVVQYSINLRDAAFVQQGEVGHASH